MIGFLFVLGFEIQYSKMVPPALPPLTPLTVGRPMQYMLRKAPKHPPTQIARKDGSLDWFIGGRRVRIRPRVKTRPLVGAVPGRDGSIRVIEKIPWDGSTRRYVIARPAQRKLIARAYEPHESYLDARYSFFETNVDYSAPHTYFPSGPPLLEMDAGETRKTLGLGSPLKVWEKDEILVNVPVDEEGRPNTMEFNKRSFLRLYLHGRPVEIGYFKLLRALKDRTLILVGDEDPGSVCFWRRGAFLSGYRLPPGWEPEMANARGDVLVRNGERNWGAKVLRGSVLSTVQFVRPPETQGLLWRTTDSFDEPGRIRFDAFWGEREGTFELRPATLKR